MSEWRFCPRYFAASSPGFRTGLTPLVVGDVSLESAGETAVVEVVDVGDMVTGVGVFVLFPLLLFPCN